MTLSALVPSVLALLLGLLAGATLAWWRLRTDDADAHQQIRLQTELDGTRQQLVAMQAELAAARGQLGENQQQLAEARAESARWQEREKNQQERLNWLEQSREQMKKDFEALSARIFEERTQKLQEQNRTGLDDVLKPFREQLQDFRRRVDQIHSDDNRQQATLLEQIRNLQQLNQTMVEDARHLTNALKGQTKTQGNWGEMILERILEESGLVRGREYETQVSMTTESGQRRQPDVIVHLPDNKDVIVDAKVSLTAYERFCREDDEELRRQALDEHVQSLRSHIRGLNRKEYEGLDGVQTLDFVLLFIPVEAAFLSAMEKAPELYNEAYNKHIVLVSPTTLLVTLRTINNIWRNEYQNRNALEIADRAGKICDQITLIAESLDDVGDKLGKAQKAYDTAYDRLSRGRGNLLGQAHKLQSLGARARKQLPAPQDDNEE
ncbi:DNA recombination protein RmuC [Alcanivorax sp. 1008]|uniref:DNA recombination protein RmuC n=1 Tax=Alcanivorax sp. 1008 TaxID=2816853 RepID=UPI001DF22358|nr:DNA recombination protein RmuC [Alcanivorax sp. 1008]MCC1497710.1 DNA recombination protein RmuC [Alcanivorax sp. 1008]